jgi:hypothetical protein
MAINEKLLFRLTIEGSAHTENYLAYYNLLSNMLDLEDDIASFPEQPYDFMRYLAARIALMNLEQKPSKEKYYDQYTDESQRIIDKFLDYAIEVYNQSHDYPVSIELVRETLQNWWHEDTQNYNAMAAKIQP